MKRVPLSSLPIATWPEEARMAWEARSGKMGWNGKSTTRVSQVFGLYLAFKQDQPVCADEQKVIAAFVEWLSRYLSGRSTLAYAVRLSNALSLVEPAADRAWLVDWCRVQRRKLSPPANRPQKIRRPRSGRGLPVEQWPPELRARWNTAIRRRIGTRYRDKLKEQHPASSWCTDTASNVTSAYGLYLRLAAAEGFDPEPTPAGIDRFVECNRSLVSLRSLAHYVTRISAAARVLFPDADWTWLQEDALFLIRAGKQEPPARDKTARIVLASELRDLAIRLFDEADRRTPSIMSAIACRNTLMMLMLTFKPLRRRNLAELRIRDITFHQGGGAMYVERTKNKNPDQHPLPPTVTARVRRFLDRHRPLLPAAKTSDYLWLSCQNGAVTRGSITRIVTELTTRELGKRVSPHLFRDAVATTITEQGGPTSLVSRMLGQRDPKSADIYRQYAMTTDAARRLEDAIEPYRIPPPARLKRGRAHDDGGFTWSITK